MSRPLCVLALLSLYARMAHSFSWEIVTTVNYSNRLDFYDINGTLTHSENITSPLSKIENIIYDPVHDRLLYAVENDIYSFHIGARKTECLIEGPRTLSPYRKLNNLAYDPATETLFWTESHNTLYSISIKPGFNVNEKVLIPLDDVVWIGGITVDSCEGFIYYYYLGNDSTVTPYARVRFDGSDREVIIDNVASIFFDNDQKSHKLYWIDYSVPKRNGITDTYRQKFKYSDLNGENVKTIYKIVPKEFIFSLTSSREFIYLRINDYNHGNSSIQRYPKNPPYDFGSNFFIENDQHISGIATKYNIEDITREHQNCDALKSLLPNDSVCRDVSLLCVHGTKVSGEARCEGTQGHSGERCDVALCHNYCLHGDCSVSAEGQSKCRCNAGYSGERCEVDVCQGYCLNDGVCSLSEESKPVCQCTGHEGDRCEVPVFLMKCLQTVSMLRDLLNTDVTSVKGIKSTCATTPSNVC